MAARREARISLTIATIVALPVCAGAPQQGRSRADAFQEYAKREIATYAIRLLPGDRPLTLQAAPVLKWSNPIAGEIYGDVFVWTWKGRPEVVGSLHRWYSPNTHSSMEFHSLSTGLVVASRDGRDVWLPSRPGIEMKPIPGAPAPSGAPAGRLRQMRELAAEFTGRETRRNDTERDTRLLSQPIYRYDDHEEPVVDGALFAFVQGTDPETFLLIEARRAEGAAPRWHYGLARMNSVPLRISHRGRPIWAAPPISWEEAADPSRPYFSFIFNQ